MIELSMVGADALTDRLDAIAGRLQTEVQAGLAEAAERLRREIVDNRLSGQVLNAHSGRLRGSIMVATGNQSVSVTSDLPYAAAQEYGFDGVETVRAHVRRIREAFGRPIAEKAVNVRSFARPAHLPARSFMRSALADLEAGGVIRGAIEDAVGRALA
ncbi:Bacteriophage HK97-gp10, putative tail-component [Sphingomonas sp. YR710]|uniref:HK97 gp10 family phage protein n=1 Tax=Sphingomonas sp. YR710 TaxID=1882773 RepID=UPI0008874A42|nr:HK97 gp10 family phage protein [Sphingomonas sp. YR710]SDC50111.1 Bacteriophage HK97-gp10, putative tail-component [Sphingomonas sp. YR710]